MTQKLRLTTFLLVLTLLLPLAIAQGEGTEAVAADRVFTNGFIYTVDDAGTIASALAVKDGLILYVGNDEEAAAYIGENTEVIDLEERLMLPGFIDGHLHSVTPDFFDFTLLDAFTLEDTLAGIEAFVAANPDAESYYGFGYQTNIFTDEELELGPKKERLDAICADKPLFILSFDGHEQWCNTKFFEVHGITKDTEIPMGGLIEKDPETGELWGTLKDSAIALGGDPAYPEEMLLPALMDFQAGLNSYGYTSIVTLPAYGTMAVPFDGYIALEEQNLLTLRVHGAISIMCWRWEDDLAKTLDAREKYNTNLVHMNTAKLFMDGVIDARSALLLEPYADILDYNGMAAWEFQPLKETYAALNEAGIQAHTHAIGDGGLRMALDALEYAKDTAPAGDYRNAITHLQVVAEEDVPRFAELDVIPVMQPYWIYKAPEYWDVVEYAALGQRAEKQYPMKSFLDAGVPLVSASDYPVTVDPNPFIAIEVGVTRNLPFSTEAMVEYDGYVAITDMDDPQWLLWPEERVTVEDMIRSYTMNGAYLTFSEDIVGSLEVGKQADLIILDQNILEIDPLLISETQVLQTYLMGYLVYEAE